LNEIHEQDRGTTLSEGKRCGNGSEKRMLGPPIHK